MTGLSSLRAERSNPALNAGRSWIASSLALLAMTGGVQPQFGKSYCGTRPQRSIIAFTFAMSGGPPALTAAAISSK
jgi:hypothetical protein